MGGADRNCYNLGHILGAGIPRLQNIQQLPTLGGKNLDVLLTNMGSFYSAPEIVPPFGCDDPRKGVPSDHSVPVVYPVNNATLGTGTHYTERSTRPLPDSGVRDFGVLLIDEGWSSVREEDSPETQEAAFQDLVGKILDKSCPIKTVKLRTQDKPYMTEELKLLHRKRTRQYRKHGKSPEYSRLTKHFDSKLLKASSQFLKKNFDSLLQAKPGQAYKVLKRMGAQPGDNPEDGSFLLPEYSRLWLSAEESADRLAQTFADISQEFPPLVVSNLPERIQNILNQRHSQSVPFVSRQMVEDRLCKTKTSKGGVPGDLPTRLIKEFAPELSVPVSQIFRSITRSGIWPKRWRTEQGLALKTIPVPLTELFR